MEIIMRKRIEEDIKELYDQILGMLAMISMFFFWIPLLAGVGFLLDNKVKSGILYIGLGLFMIILWVGYRNQDQKD